MLIKRLIVLIGFLVLLMGLATYICLPPGMYVLKGKTVLLADSFKSGVNTDEFISLVKDKGYEDNQIIFSKEKIQNTEVDFKFPGVLVIKPFAVKESILIRGYDYQGIKVDLIASFFNKRLESVYIECNPEKWNMFSDLVNRQTRGFITNGKVYEKGNLIVSVMNQSYYGSRQYIIWKDKVLSEQNSHCNYNMFTE
jgi:hypothetical protein